ncbi:ABC transporter ATP-binding protein [Microscilla marina]|uniref:ATPase n=1 Tax=Microscilla marina ATCC 23134 TaxID=313606 RepID=A1ZLY1_MICM2|nr:ABC transporter ATP-binding protein [Microscilla marina]EAY28513.1 ATPase [Microscilla marina ATCC 23134]
MSEVVLSVENVSKCYKSYDQRTSFQDTLRQFFTSKKQVQSQSFWALKEVSFDLKQGDVLGLLGKNGAGKSTLLKILAQVTPPTTGQITFWGSINALLEVGTGFHPDLTGRENIFLNGGILGMTKGDIQQQLDQMIDFAELAQFIDTPVKHYSSGMYMRLAFTVAIHLRFDILVLDEILAVGDAAFQKKCIQYIKQHISQGKSVIICSHNQTQLAQLCNRGLVLGKGKQMYEGTIQKSLQFYAQMLYSPSSSSTHIQVASEHISLYNHPNKTYTNSQGMISAVLYCDHRVSDQMYSGCHFKCEVHFEHSKPFIQLIFGFVVKNSFNQEVLGVNNQQQGVVLSSKDPQKGTITITIPQLLLYGDGNYSLDLYLGDQQHIFDVILDALSFRLIPTDVYKSGVLPKTYFNHYYQPDLTITCV